MRAISMCILIACGPSAPPPLPAPVLVQADTGAPIDVAPASDAGVPSSTATAAISRSSASLTTSGDLDGVAGDERVTLGADGTLTAGAATIAVQLDEADPVSSEQAKIEIVALGGKRRGVLLTTRPSEGEDPPNRYRVFLFDKGTLRPVFDQVIGVYGVTPLVFSAAGNATYVESDWMACNRMKGAKKAMRQTVTLALGASGTQLVERSRKATGQVQNCDELSACPYVYVLTNGQALRVGEILRNVRGAAAATQQSLALGTFDAGSIAIRIAEEKLEVTFVDEIYVDVAGERLAPRACDAPVMPAYCVADGQPHVMHQGEILDLTFDVPAHASGTLVARGYYVPTPTAATTRQYVRKRIDAR